MKQSVEGTELRSRRIRIGCSRNEVAHALGVDVPTLQEWEDEAAPIGCPAAVELVLRKLESQKHDREDVLDSYAN